MHDEFKLDGANKFNHLPVGFGFERPKMDIRVILGSRPIIIDLPTMDQQLADDIEKAITSQCSVAGIKCTTLSTPVVQPWSPKDNPPGKVLDLPKDMVYKAPPPLGVELRPLNHLSGQEKVSGPFSPQAANEFAIAAVRSGKFSQVKLVPWPKEEAKPCTIEDLPHKYDAVKHAAPPINPTMDGLAARAGLAYWTCADKEFCRMWVRNDGKVCHIEPGVPFKDELERFDKQYPRAAKHEQAEPGQSSM